MNATFWGWGGHGARTRTRDRGTEPVAKGLQATVHQEKELRVMLGLGLKSPGIPQPLMFQVLGAGFGLTVQSKGQACVASVHSLRQYSQAVPAPAAV